MRAARLLKVCALLWLSLAAAAPRPALVLDVLDLAAISRMTPQQLEALAGGLAADEIMRSKRSSAGAAPALQSKLGLLGRASALVSSASAKSGSEHAGYSYEPHEEKYDYWGLKKSILFTLFQAVKAITGGVTILKGQLIKGGGALASSLGKVIAGKGDAVSNLGKKIVSSAALSEKKPHSSVVYGPPPVSHVEYGPPATYGVPSAPAHYPTGPSLPSGYAAHKYPASLDGSGGGLQAGLLLLAPAGEAARSVLGSVVGAIKSAFGAGAHPAEPAPAAEPEPATAPGAGWESAALDSYGAPAAAAALQPYPAYDPRAPAPPFERAAPAPPAPDYRAAPAPLANEYRAGLSPEKIQKINFNLAKVEHYVNQQARSLDAPAPAPLPGPEPGSGEDEVGVLPAALQPAPAPAAPAGSRRTDYKYFLRGNRIVLV